MKSLLAFLFVCVTANVALGEPSLDKPYCPAVKCKACDPGQKQLPMNKHDCCPRCIDKGTEKFCCPKVDTSIQCFAHAGYECGPNVDAAKDKKCQPADQNVCCPVACGGTRCMTKPKVCRNGNDVYCPGESYNDGCNECTCRDGTISCTEKACTEA